MMASEIPFELTVPYLSEDSITLEVVDDNDSGVTYSSYTQAALEIKETEDGDALVRRETGASPGLTIGPTSILSSGIVPSEWESLPPGRYLADLCLFRSSDSKWIWTEQFWVIIEQTLSEVIS